MSHLHFKALSSNLNFEKLSNGLLKVVHIKSGAFFGELG
jgi:hypothetical protein